MTQDSSRVKVIRWVQKLLALTTSSNEQEAAAAAARAQEIMFRHKLTTADVQALTSEQVRTEIKIYGAAREFPVWKRILAKYVATNNFGDVLSIPGGLLFVGKADDIEFIKFLFEYLVDTLEKLAETAWVQRRDYMMKYAHTRLQLGNKRYGVTWKNSFYHGAAMVINDRLKAKRREEEAKAWADMRLLNQADRTKQENALTVIRQMDKQVEKFMQDIENREGVRTANYKVSVDRSGIEAGRDAGRRVGLDKQINA